MQDLDVFGRAATLRAALLQLVQGGERFRVDKVAECNVPLVEPWSLRWSRNEARDCVPCIVWRGPWMSPPSFVSDSVNGLELCAHLQVSSKP